MGILFCAVWMSRVLILALAANPVKIKTRCKPSGAR
jgi:hypothetical protein